MRNHNTTPQPGTAPNVSEQYTRTIGDYAKAPLYKIRRGLGNVASSADYLSGTIRLDKHLQSIRNEREDWTASEERRDQNKAYLSYSENLYAAYVPSYVETMSEIRLLKHERNKERAKYYAKRLGSAAMWVPGLDVIGSRVMEMGYSRKIDKQIRSKYINKNGSFIGNIKKTRAINKDKFMKEKNKITEKSTILKSRQEWLNIDN